MVIALLYLSEIDHKTENIDKQSAWNIENKVNVQESHQSTDYTEEVVVLSGAEVYSEIAKQDGSVSVRVNNELLNSIQNIDESGKDFFSYVTEYGPQIIKKKVSLEATYAKTFQVDENGNITEIRYQVYQ